MSIPHIKRKEWDKGLEEGKRKYGERGEVNELSCASLSVFINRINNDTNRITIFLMKKILYL